MTKESISEEDEEYENNDGESIDEPADALYLQTRKRRPLQQYKHQSTRVRPPRQRQNYSHLPTSSNWKENLNPRTSQGKNPLKNGQPARCNICQSINHWATQCLDRNLDEVAMIDHELVLQNSNDTVLQSLLSETWCSAVLDSGATSTVYGQVWFDEYFKILPSEQQSKITFITSSKQFRFGDGRQLTSVKAATIPATIGSCKVEIKTDIIDSDIQLLLSKAAMKKAQIVLNFNNDTITFQGHQINSTLHQMAYTISQLLNQSHSSTTSPRPATKIK